MQSGSELLTAIYTAWREKRLADTLAFLTDDFRMTVHLPPGTIEGAGLPHDKAQTADLLGNFISTYDFLDYEPGDIDVSPDGAHATASPLIRYRHKESGQVIQTRLSHFWSLRGGQAASLDEYHDTARIQAFLSKVAAG